MTVVLFSVTSMIDLVSLMNTLPFSLFHRAKYSLSHVIVQWKCRTPIPQISGNRASQVSLLLQIRVWIRQSRGWAVYIDKFSDPPLNLCSSCYVIIWYWYLFWFFEGQNYCSKLHNLILFYNSDEFYSLIRYRNEYMHEDCCE